MKDNPVLADLKDIDLDVEIQPEPENAVPFGLYEGGKLEELLSDEPYLKWLTTQSNEFLADLQSRYPVFMSALSEALAKVAAPKPAPVKQTTNLAALKRQAKKASVRKKSVESPGKVAAKPAPTNQPVAHPSDAPTAPIETEPTYLERIRACQLAYLTRKAANKK